VYLVFDDGTHRYNVPLTGVDPRTYTDTGVAAGTHTYTVTSRDAAGYESPASNAVTATVVRRDRHDHGRQHRIPRVFCKLHSNIGVVEGQTVTDQVLSGTDLSRLRELNSLTVVQALRDQPPATVTELAKLTGLSRPAVDVIAQGLVTGGWATIVEPGGSSVVGRPARP
jgi:hypothetical protein